jgi:Transmembrane domain of unknown function (DUF3566)
MTDRSTERTATHPGADGARDDDTAVRAPLGERISAKLSDAASEHRANAQPDATRVTKATAAGRRPPRRARLRLTRIDPWSVMKTSFLLAIAFAVVTVVSVFIIWSVLSASGVWDSINDTVRDVVGGEEAGAWDVEKYVGLSRVMGFTILVSVVDVILITAIATLGAFLYNMSAALLGGVELTLAEDER